MIWSSARWTLAVLAVLWCLWPSAGLAQGPAELEKGIREYLAQGRLDEACRLAVKMQPFKGQPEYDRAQALLLERGISLASPLESLSIQRMIALQNLLEAQRRQTRRLPRTGPYPDHVDAWGSPVRVEMITRRAFVYLLRSAGPDRRFMTGDDLALGVRDEASSDTQLRNLRLGLAAGEGREELPAGPLVEGSGGKSQATAGDSRPQASAQEPGFDPARAAGRRGLLGVGAPPPASRPDVIPTPVAPGPGGGQRQSNSARGGQPAPEREITVDELLRR